MRNIFPTKNSTNILGKDSDIVTRDDLVILANQITAIANALANFENEVEEYKDNQTENTYTALLNATQGVINQLSSISAALTVAEIGTLTVTGVSNLQRLVASSAQIAGALDANRINAPEIDTATLEATEATIGMLRATTVAIENWTANLITATKITASEVESDSITADNGNIGDLTSTSVTAATIEANNADVDEISTDLLTAAKVKTDAINWKSYQTIVDPDEYFIEIPPFTNGIYFIEGRTSNDEVLFTIEVYNSMNNFFVRWGQSEIGLLEKYYRYSADRQIWFKGNTKGNVIHLYYCNVNSNTNAAPEEWNSLQSEPDDTYDIIYTNGSKFFSPVDLFNQGQAVSSLSLIPGSYAQATQSATAYDTSEPITFRTYLPNQDLDTNANVRFNEVVTTFLGVRDFSTRNFTATELKTLSDIDLAEFDDGAVIIIRDSSTAESVQNSSAYIKKTVNDTPVLYEIIAGKDLPASISNKPLIWSPQDGALIEATDISTNDITATGDLTVGGDTTVSGNTAIHGDLFVDGVVHTITEDQISTTSNIVTLRQNNNTSLGNTKAGIVVNKYNGADDLALVTDGTGTLQVGTGIGTTTTYADIYWVEAAQKWYTDASHTTEVTPVGNLTSWSSVEISTTEKHYTNAVFTQVNYTNLEAIATRNATANWTNNKEIALFDKNSEMLVGINTVPTANDDILHAKVNSQTGAVTYQWEQLDFTALTQAILAQAKLDAHPVGSLYWSSKSTDPGTLFGGTWTPIKDRFVWAKGDSDTINATGGAKTVTLQTANLPSHNHSLNSHTHSFTPAGSISGGAYTFTGTEHSHSYTPAGSVSVTTNPSFTGSAVNTGAMSGNSTGTLTVTTRNWPSDYTRSGNISLTSGNGKQMQITSSSYTGFNSMTIDVSHTHSVTAAGTISGGAYKFTGTAATLKATAGGSVSVTTNPAFTGTAGTTGQASGNTGSTGSGTAVNIMNPYIVKYCWERTA